MINQTQETLHKLDNLNSQYQRVSHQMSTGRILDKGSDDATLFAREIYIEDKMNVFEGIQSQIDKTTVHNSVSDSAMGDIKNLLEQVKSEIITANTDTTTPEGRKAIAVNIAGVKQNLLDLANTRVDGEYLFSGSDSSIRPFEENAGEIEYKGDTRLRKIAVDEGSYRDKGVNGFDMMMYTTNSATASNPNLDFKESDRIVDQDGFEWKLNGANNAIERYDFNGNVTTDTKAVTNVVGTPPTYTVDVGTADGTKFEAKTSIFDKIDKIVNALNKVDDAGNPITQAESDASLTNSLTDINAAYDSVNIAHAELGGRNRVFEISQEKVSSKLTQYNIMFQEVGGADLAKVAVEAKSLEMTFNALYSTINKTNELSLVNFIR
ncbi:MAG: flagellar hook-associated protein FlgL [Campylobacterota bacterium]